MYDNWIYIGGCGSAHSHGHIHLFSPICNISCHHPIANHHRWQGGSVASIFLTSSSYFLQSNSTPSERFSTLKVSGHANPPLLNHPPNIQKVSLGKVAPWSQPCQRWEHPAPNDFQAHSCCPRCPIKKFPKEIDQQVISNKSSWDVKIWSSGSISWSLVRTCHPSEQKHSPCLYTALSTTIHSPWPCNVTKVALGGAI